MSKNSHFKAPKLGFLITYTLLFLCCFSFQLKANRVSISGSSPELVTTVAGTVTDDLGEALIGASVLVVGTSSGTITGLDGTFSINIKLPATLEVSYVGYATQLIQVNEANLTGLIIALVEGGISLDEVVVGASRHSERFVEAPVTIQKIDATTLLMSGAESPFEALTNLKGVQMMKGSLSGPVLNTRGFADMNNLRFLMHLDGMDVTSPGFGVYSNVGGVSNLDLQSMEIIPGSSSALYGANAFNGILLAKTKDPFIHQGFSALFKTGVSVQGGGFDTNPYNTVALRYAKKLSDKIAIKIDYEGTFATDWIANDFRTRDGSNDASTPANPNLDEIDPNSFTYDGLNIYGDGDNPSSRVFSGLTPVTTSDGLISDTLRLSSHLTRTGYTEAEMFVNDINNHRINIGLSFKLNDDWRLDALARWGTQDIVLRHTTSYPIKGFQISNQKIELTGKGLTARVYTNFQNIDEAWVSLLTATNVERDLMSNEEWGQRFVDAYFGDSGVSGVPTGDIGAARAYADSGMPQPGSPAFQAALDKNTQNLNKLLPDGTYGSRLFDNSFYVQGDVIYDFAETMIKDPSWKLSLGASLRKTSLQSDGSLFNDNRLTENLEQGENVGFDGAININEGGIFGKVAKNFIDGRLNISLIGRANFHSQFATNFTPQASVVYSPDKKRNHNLRVSYTTGVRNPGAQEQYINFVFTPIIAIIGGLQDNIDNFLVPGSNVTGPELIDLFETDGTGFNRTFQFESLRPERNSTFEIGYKGLMVNNKLLVDINYYSTTYQDFVARATLRALSADLPAGAYLGLLYQNIPNDVSQSGFGISLEYSLPANMRAYTNFQRATFEAEVVADLPIGLNFPAFNTPETRLNFGLRKMNIKGGLGFDIAARYISDWDFTGPSGKSVIPSVFTIDASVSYRLNNNWNFLLSGSNIFNADYFTITGGPNVGSVFTVGAQYDLRFQ